MSEPWSQDYASIKIFRPEIIGKQKPFAKFTFELTSTPGCLFPPLWLQARLHLCSSEGRVIILSPISHPRQTFLSLGFLKAQVSPTVPRSRYSPWPTHKIYASLHPPKEISSRSNFKETVTKAKTFFIKTICHPISYSSWLFFSDRWQKISGIPCLTSNFIQLY